MSQVTSRQEWLIGKIKSVTTDKDYIIRHLIFDMLNKSTRMFEYDGLPDTIKPKDLELQLQVNGFAIWKEVDGKLYTFTGGLGGEPNPYYLPTKATIANPALSYSAVLNIDEDCVVMLNDYLYEGFMPIFNKYASLLADAEMSLRYAILNARIPALIQADNDTAKQSAEEFIESIVSGKNYGIIGSNGFFEGIKTQDFLKQTHIKEIIEAVQYLKGSWYNAIGLNATFNMKREAINEFEAGLNEDILVPLIDVLLECRQKGIDLVNKMFGKNITVRLSSVWGRNRDEDMQAFEYKEAEIDLLESEAQDVEEDSEEVREDVAEGDVKS